MNNNLPIIPQNPNTIVPNDTNNTIGSLSGIIPGLSGLSKEHSTNLLVNTMKKKLERAVGEPLKQFTAEKIDAVSNVINQLKGNASDTIEKAKKTVTESECALCKQFNCQTRGGSKTRRRKSKKTTSKKSKRSHRKNKKSRRH